ncbi:unnamed protein product, partial [Discosporangium mesarthrocarpum]
KSAFTAADEVAAEVFAADIAGLLADALKRARSRRNSSAAVGVEGEGDSEGEGEDEVRAGVSLSRPGVPQVQSTRDGSSGGRPHYTDLPAERSGTCWPQDAHVQGGIRGVVAREVGDAGTWNPEGDEKRVVGEVR